MAYSPCVVGAIVVIGALNAVDVMAVIVALDRKGVLNGMGLPCVCGDMTPDIAFVVMGCCAMAPDNATVVMGITGALYTIFVIGTLDDIVVIGVACVCGAMTPDIDIVVMGIDGAL